uniref:Uncharacterized protein n=1 Tax=Onchocerca volvulus TaxID=6282 RepID=A0A8R1XY64_ONCVO
MRKYFSDHLQNFCPFCQIRAYFLPWPIFLLEKHNAELQ